MTPSAYSVQETPHTRYLRRRRREFRQAMAALVVVAVAWIYGFWRSGSDIESQVKNVLVGTRHVVEQDGVYVAYGTDRGTPIGYAAVGEAAGYGGPVMMLVGVDRAGEIAGIQVIEQHETPGFFAWLREDDFFGAFLGRTQTDSLRLGEGIDAVTGATLSSEAVALGIARAVNTIHASQSADTTQINLGWPEITLIALFVSGFLTARSHHSRLKRWIRAGMLGTGVIVLGFMLNKPLTLAHFTAFLSGYWPDWHTNLYWYLLLGGVVLATFARGRNPYCSWFCPFGGVQECLGALSGAQYYRPQPLYARLKSLQRGLALVAIVLGLALRQPAATSYEPFGTLFALAGGFFPWMFLVIILFSSLIIRRPFCTYLCPIDPVIEFIGRLRGWTLTRWTSRRTLSSRADRPSSSHS